ncbi:unnamed protein product [Candidula unifasciata]|uniref:Uncharacterized protein n=1 Tax=Candidula unifasciata TaxID=100452 RepID=A0A8S3ZBW2_9EUPU|nr:unnamed protein product [Candidula unifasciata]
MGNHGSRKDQRKWGKQGGKAARALSRVEELRGPPVDSYDKLIAWLAEMAEHDNVELDTSVFVSQLNRVCQEQAENHHLGVSASGGFGNGSPLTGGSSPGACGSRAPNTRQNSTSCDSHVSHASSDVTQRNRSSTRSDDFLDPSSAWKSGVSTRQNTFSDDLEEEEDSELRNASVESLYSSTDRDSELGSILADDANCRRSGRNFQSSSPLFRATVSKKLRCIKGNYVMTPCSASFGNLELYDRPQLGATRCHPHQYVKKSVSLLDLSKTEPITPPKTIPKVVLTHDSDLTPESRPLLEHTVIRKKLGSGPKSLSLTSGRKKQAKLERHFSLHSDPRPFPSSMFGRLLPPIFTTPPVEEATPVKSPDDAAVFLDGDLLDRNIADILFSVEALWPKK